MSPKHDIKRYYKQQNFQVPQFQSVSVFFKLVHPFLFCTEQLFLSFTQFGGGSQWLKFRDTALLT